MSAYDFDTTFREFLATGWSTAATRARRQAWLDVRDAARTRWARVLALRSKNAPHTDAVLEGLLPYADTESNRARGCWLHPSSTLTLDVRAWFEDEGLTLSGDWPVATYATVQFIERCMLCPDRQQEVCDRYMQHPEVRGFQSSLLSPILNALVPDTYRVVNAAALAALRAFTGIPWSPRIETYPKVNEALAAFLREHRAVLGAAGDEAHLPCDLFDLFARWFVAYAPELLEEPWEGAQRALGEPRDLSCWKVTPGDRAQRWFKCLADESVAFAWPDLGDLSTLSRDAFEARLAKLSRDDDGYRDCGLECLWSLAHAPAGTLLVAARGTAQVLGIGRVTGPYRFSPGESFPHRLDVDWFDPGERAVSQPTWTRALVRVDPRWVGSELDVPISGIHARVEDDAQSAVTTLVRETPPPPRAAPDARRSTFTAPTVRMEPDDDALVGVADGGARLVHVTSAPPAPWPLPDPPEAGVAPMIEAAMGRTLASAIATLPFGDDAPALAAETYTLAQCADDTGFREDELRRWVEAIKRKGQAIVTGATGVGKTFLAQRLARHLATSGVVEQLPLHAGYRYADFVEWQEGPARVPGRLLEFLARHGAAQGASVLLLDDVQRADLARVMGEALHALEYRAQPARLASGTELVVPRDVYVIGTLNASHRAITTADQSLRRRFAFIALPPRYDVLARYLAARGFDAAGLVDTLRAMNQALGVDAAVGTAMFFRDDLADVLDDVWEHEVEAHLAQHLAHDPGALASYRWARVCDAVRPTARRALGA